MRFYVDESPKMGLPHQNGIVIAPPFQKLIIPDEKRLFLYFSFRVFSSQR
jgi:hypothetical protein